ncbi:acyl-CoA-binding domain-containing protein 5 [Caerostris extrusa]|uniref:Acyl-CoA-binding domain-containing protein 5 n=1 Tax=Caerostris extrusa TaxID=172846 RepID=A0AAV4Y7W8_CAEEX|nr:acyl-CoA-binding domain-containing protein 5 [Caerostris extrusa]
MNGKIKQPLNNNSEDHIEENHSSHYGLLSKDYKNGISREPEDYPTPVNGHNLNGNNDSDSDEFSDTLDRINEDDPPEASLTNGKPVANDNPLTDKGPSIVNMRGGGDHRVGSNEGGSSAGGPSNSRGNQFTRQQRSSDYPLHSGSDARLVGGAGGSRRGGEESTTEISSDMSEQLAMAVIRLQHSMEQVVIRLESLETLLLERRANNNSLQIST